MKKIIYNIIILLGVLSCSDLEVIPDGVNTADNLFETEEDAEAAVNAVYSSLQTADIYNQFMEAIQSQGTDDAEWGYGRNTSNTNKLQMDKFQFDASSDLILRFWKEHYVNINRANIVIKRIAEMDINEDLKNRFLGEAHFVRALMYFNLVRLYGAVPVVTEPTESLEGLNVARSSTDIVYELIEEDLKFAELNLPVQYGTENYGRATKGAALGLLAKVYLTNKQYIDAKNTAEDVMDLGVYSLWASYVDVFDIANENIKESIFEIQFTSTGDAINSVSSSFQGFFKPSAQVMPPGPGEFAGYGDNPVTENHFQIYNEGDERRDVNVLYVPSAPSSIQFPYYVNKYQDPEAVSVQDGGNNYYILRYADILLMYAEAINAEEGPTVEAYSAFNKVRRRAFGFPVNVESLADLTEGLTKEQFQDSLELERRKEFAFEGQRRFDLLRWGKLKEAVEAQDPSITVQEKHNLFPIPEQEIIVNDLLAGDQNPGY
ncbi:RagB/SusD family nutrient uptake outer membrane protein [Salegentibacter maritimus]|uniref:RagB/SusD family nutrient uptake outer membrane protein n=1 Tax=Salegentibacter maritimus TaxID=2794347 RepID=UPI0018E4460D|nr:RagB/SusD family nutrient uptake outer membrane protein [Salegentibacter maritimus]MBI6117602.1 RagB/SusD family nutrient uptake outer membrane protein [Salegentibacter maritimus]